MSALSGRVIDQFSGLPVAGVAVKYGGLAAVQTNAEGRFDVPGTADTTIRPLTFSRTGFFTRTTRAAAGDRDWGLVPATFAMPAYDDVARQEYGVSTTRWVAFPTVYIDTRFSHVDMPKWVEEIRIQVVEFLEKWTHAAIRAAAVIATANPPADLAAGTIKIKVSNNNADFGGSGDYIGYARKSSVSDRSIVAGLIAVRYSQYRSNPGKRRGILGHELGHVLGYGHMGPTTPASLMYYSIGSKTDLKPFDGMIARLCYDREPGTASPDTYGGTTTGRKPRRRKAGGVLGEVVEETRELKVREWVCGGPEDHPRGKR